LLCKVSKREKVDERERKKEKTLSLSFFLPESLSTSPLISPTPSPKAASSKTLCICPLPKTPRSPPLRAEEQCDSAAASEAKAAASPEGAPAAERSTCSRNAETAALASPSDRVTTGSFQDEGRREPACLTRRWEARTEEGPDALAAAAAALSALAAAAAAAGYAGAAPSPPSSRSKVNDAAETVLLLPPPGAPNERLEPLRSAVGLCRGSGGAPSRETATVGHSAMRNVLPSEW